MKMKTMLVVIIVYFSICGVTQEPSQPPVKTVSLIQLIANPDKHDGQRVNVIGYLRLESEGNILYLSVDDYKNSVAENGIWVDINNEINSSRSRLDRKYVQLLGTFSSRKMGNSLGAGSI